MPPGITNPRPHNLNISKELSYALILGGTSLGLAGIVVAVLIFGEASQKTIVVTTVIGLLSLIVTNVVSALKSTEAADTSSRNHQVSLYTSSQNATVMQRLQALEERMNGGVNHE